MIGAGPGCSSRRASSIRRQPSRTSTPAPVAAWTRARSRAWPLATGSKPATACSSAAQPARGSHGSLAPWRSMPAGAGTPSCTCVCRDLARNCACCTATAASPNGCYRSPAFTFSYWTIGEWANELKSLEPFCFDRKATNEIARCVVMAFTGRIQVDPEHKIEASFLKALKLLLSGGKLQ